MWCQLGMCKPPVMFRQRSYRASSNSVCLQPTAPASIAWVRATWPRTAALLLRRLVIRLRRVVSRLRRFVKND
eukprot:11766237-Heterocapsa_arctica.AAC.1